MLAFTVSRTYETYTPPEDPDAEAIDGDSDHGYVYEDQEQDLRDVIRELRDMNWLSCSPCCSNGHCWAEQEHWTSDWGTGETRAESIHISHVNGKPITGHQKRRLFRAAGLIK